MNILDKYKKYSESKAQTSNNEESSGGYTKFAYYNPAKHVDEHGKEYNNGNKTVKRAVVRVLPNKREGEFFFYEFQKHRFKVGAVNKTAFCLYSTNPENGDTVYNKCPFCDFIEENHESISQDQIKALRSKESQIMFVYVYSEDEVKKYETNYYSNTKMMPMVIKLIEDGVDIEHEGFDLIFEKDGSNWPDIIEARAPKHTLAEILEKSAQVNEFPDLWDNVVPKVSENFIKSINSTFEYGIKALCPTFAKNDSSQIEYDAVEESYSSASSYDPNADDDSMSSSKTSKIMVDDDDDYSIPKQKSVKKPIQEDDSLDGLEDIQSFVSELKSRSNKSTVDDDIPF